jgi:ribosome recycling factor
MNEEQRDELLFTTIVYCKSLRTDLGDPRRNLFNAIRKQVRLDLLEDRYEMAKETIDDLYELIVEVKKLDRQFGKGEVCAMKE